MKNNVSYHSLQSLYRLGVLLVLLLISFIIANPMVTSFSQILEENTELYENSEEEKELVDYDQTTNLEFHATYPFDSELIYKEAINNNYILKKFSDFDPKILVPPPRNS